jgi:hypothetical protein
VNSLSGVVVIQDDLYDFTGFEHDLIGVGAIDCCVRGIGTCRENSVERRHFRSYVCYVIEKSTIVVLVKYISNLCHAQRNLLIGTIIQVIHFHVQLEGVINMVIDTLLVLRYEVEVIKGIKLINLLRIRLLFAFIVHEPPCDIWI